MSAVPMTDILAAMTAQHLHVHIFQEPYRRDSDLPYVSVSLRSPFGSVSVAGTDLGETITRAFLSYRQITGGG